AVGFSSTPADLETLVDIPFAIVLKPDAVTKAPTVYIFENGAQVGGDHGTYDVVLDTFRVRISEKTDGSNTATLSATKLTGVSETLLATASIPSLAYPLSVDVSLTDLSPALLTARLVRIQ